MRLSLDWLERNVPDFDGPVVLVQGDTGPGNFMYENGKVTAVVDWELAHFGDPMDDIAWLSLRTVQDTFTHFPDRLREYEELSGNAIDAERVWYYRLFAETRLTSNSAGAGAMGSAPREGQPVARDIGNGIIYGMLHRRLTIEALANVMGFELPPADLPDEPPRRAVALVLRRDAREPPGDRAEDRRPAGVAVDQGRRAGREVPQGARPLRTRVRRRRSSSTSRKLLGHEPASLVEGRRGLARAVSEGAVKTRTTCGTSGGRCSATTT